jgi:hypothetical protein
VLGGRTYVLTTFISVCSSSDLLFDLGHLLSFLIIYTVGRTPSTGVQPVARPLPTHRATQTQNKRTQTPVSWVGFEPTIPAFERAKTVHAVDLAGTVIGIDGVYLFVFFAFVPPFSHFSCYCVYFLPSILPFSFFCILFFTCLFVYLSVWLGVSILPRFVLSLLPSLLD